MSRSNPLFPGFNSLNLPLYYTPPQPNVVAAVPKVVNTLPTIHDIQPIPQQRVISQKPDIFQNVGLLPYTPDNVALKSGVNMESIFPQPLSPIQITAISEVNPQTPPGIPQPQSLYRSTPVNATIPTTNQLYVRPALMTGMDPSLNISPPVLVNIPGRSSPTDISSYAISQEEAPITLPSPNLRLAPRSPTLVPYISTPVINPSFNTLYKSPMIYNQTLRP